AWATVRRTPVSATSRSKSSRDPARSRRAAVAAPRGAARCTRGRSGHPPASSARGDHALLAQLDPPERALGRDPRARPGDRRTGGGVVESNSLAVTDLRRSLAGAAELARASRPDDGWPGLADPETVTKPHAFDEATATAGAADQAAAIAHICRGLRSGMRAAGTSQHELTEDAVANTRGVALYARGSLAYLRALVQSDVGSGYAEDLTWRAGELDPAGVAARAVEKCALDRDRSELPPGDYEAVFEELAVAETLRIVSLTGLGGQSV